MECVMLVIVVLGVLWRDAGGSECGGVVTSEKGLMSSPGFPGPFQVPLNCRWVIDSSQFPGETTTVVYLTQLYVSTGLTFTEFGYYEPDSPFQLEPKLLHQVTESNVLSVQWVWTKRKYFVIDFELKSLEGNHLRVLDHLLDVYGFNITYEIRETTPDNPVRNNSCSVTSCSLAGQCFASHDFTDYWCGCFPGFYGEDCNMGPLCQPDTNICRNGATCRHVGKSALCICAPGFTGPQCDVRVTNSDCEPEEDCSVQCRFDGLKENLCNCDSVNTRVSPERSRFELKVMLADVTSQRIKHPGRTLRHVFEKQVSKYLKATSLSNVEDLEVLNITGHDGKRVREAGEDLVERGRLGDLELSTSYQPSFLQEPPLSLETVHINHRDPIVREGDRFILSCVAQGSSYITFNWYKDGALINATKSIRKIWGELLPQDSRLQHTSIMEFDDVNILDEGQYTCQVVDWGVQECKSIYIEVMEAPQVHISPMSATIQKGDDIKLKCISQNQRGNDQIGYSWTRDNFLFPMVPGKEYWEDLKPAGTILRVYNIQKTTTYTCKANAATASRAQTVKIDVVNKSSISICAGHYSDGVKWVDAGPGSSAISECPHRYLGIARKLCLMNEPGKALWQTPDFSECISVRLDNILTKFHTLMRGFEITSVADTLLELTSLLKDRSELYSGEGEPVVSLLQEMLAYINATSLFTELGAGSNYFFEAVDSLLHFPSAIIHKEKVSGLQLLLNNWALLWGMSNNSSISHLAYDNMVIDLIAFKDAMQYSYYFPMLSASYPEWYNTKLAIHVIGQNFSHAETFHNRISVVTYRNISKYLSSRATQKLEDGSEMIYEIMSIITSISSTGELKHLHIELDLPVRTLRAGWNVTCAVAKSLGDDWDFKSCNYSIKQNNISQCVCQRFGVYAGMLTSHSAYNSLDQGKHMHPSSIVMVGCTYCLIQTLFTLVLLLIQCIHHNSCILFLKIQCCISTAASMTIFIYTTNVPIPQYSFCFVNLIMETLIFIGISTHLSKLLIVYTEVVNLPNVKHIKYTVFGIIIGVTILAVLSSLLAHHLSGNTLLSWWLPFDSMMFYVAIICWVLLATLFTFLYCNLMHRLKLMLKIQNLKSTHVVSHRMGFLKRTAILFTCTLIMAISSTLYVNIALQVHQYMFGISCALLGLITFICYIICSESPLHFTPFKKSQKEKTKEQEYNSDSDNNLFNFFTKQEAEMESDSAPPCLKKPVMFPMTNMLPNKENVTMKPKLVTFNGSTPTSKRNIEKKEVDLEDYPNSPRKYVMEPLGSKSASQYQLDNSESPTDKIRNESDQHLEPQFINAEEVLPTKQIFERETTESAEPQLTSLLTCSVDIEPSSSEELKGPETAGDAQFVKIEDLNPSEEKSETEPDVLDRITHDLDYLLNRTEVSPYVSYDEANSSIIKNT